MHLACSCFNRRAAHLPQPRLSEVGSEVPPSMDWLGTSFSEPGPPPPSSHMLWSESPCPADASNTGPCESPTAMITADSFRYKRTMEPDTWHAKGTEEQ